MDTSDTAQNTEDKVSSNDKESDNVEQRVETPKERHARLLQEYKQQGIDVI